MKAVILAAGRGTRIDEVTHGMPKCLLSFGDRSILDCQIEGLLGSGVANVGIVVGHNATRIINHIRRYYPDRRKSFHFIHNREYTRTNNIYSLWMARQWVKGDGFFCLNADVLCHPDILRAAGLDRSAASMIVDPEWRDETMKVVISDGRIVRMSKSIGRDEYSGTYIGITRFSREVTGPLFEQIGRMIRQGLVNDFFNAAVQTLVDTGLRVNPTFTRGLPWAEVDDAADHRFAWENVYPRLPWGIGQPIPAVA